MDLTAYTPIARQITEGNRLDIPLGPDERLSLPVAIRRDNIQYDALFFYRQPTDDLFPRPHAWAMLEATTGQTALYAQCALVDFISGERYPADSPLTGERAKSLSGKKETSLRQKMLEAYEEIRAFAFQENLDKAQAAAVSDYKDAFRKLIHPAHQAFYYALSPAFFHWLRIPLPTEALQNSSPTSPDLQTDGYQVLILQNLQALAQQFQQKIAAGQRHHQLFDTLHRDLQEYKNGLFDKLTLSLERDIIQLIDGVAKSVQLFREKEPTPEEYARLLAMLDGVQTDLRDLLYRHGVEPYTADGLDVRRQKIVQTIPTANAALDKTIAERLAPGWEKEQKIIRPERISVYLLKEEADADE